MKQKKCVQCGELIDYSAEYCPFCSAKQPVLSGMDRAQAEKEKRKAHPPTDSYTVPVEDSPERKVSISPERAQEIKTELKKTRRAQEDVTAKVEEVAAKVDQTTEKVTRLEEAESTRQQEAAKDAAMRDPETGLLNGEAFQELLASEPSNPLAIGCVEFYQTVKRKTDKDPIALIADTMIKIFGADRCYRTGEKTFVFVRDNSTEDITVSDVYAFRRSIKEDIKAAVGFSYGPRTPEALYHEAKKQCLINMESLREAEKEVYGQTSEYDPNSDGYYNDIPADIEAEESESMSKDLILKSVGLVIAGIVIIILAFIFL